MDWIKKHYDQFLLALAALVLLALSGLIILKTKSFSEKFADAQTDPVPSEKVPEWDPKKVRDALKQVAAPTKWEARTGTNEYLFVPAQYMVDGGKPKKPVDGAIYTDSLTGTPGVPTIPNIFFTKNKLPLLDPTVPKQDPDKDGFANEDEWRGDRDAQDSKKWGGSTDPNDKDSHPKYVTKLFLKQWIRIPFVLLFQAYDVDTKDPKDTSKMTFQINARGRAQRTEFLKIGEKVSTGPYKLEKFEQKTIVNPKTDAEDDVSELTVTNTETNEPVILVLSKPTNSPDSVAEFDYQWNGSMIKVKKLQEFRLLPEADKPYKLIDIDEAGAVIRLPDGTDYRVVTDPRAKR